MIAYVMTTQTFTRQTVRGTKRKWTSTVVHNWTDRTWEGAHYASGQKAFDFCAAINKSLRP